MQLCEYENQTLEAIAVVSCLTAKFDCPVPPEVFTFATVHDCETGLLQMNQETGNRVYESVCPMSKFAQQESPSLVTCLTASESELSSLRYLYSPSLQTSWPYTPYANMQAWVF